MFQDPLIVCLHQGGPELASLLRKQEYVSVSLTLNPIVLLLHYSPSLFHGEGAGGEANIIPIKNFHSFLSIFKNIAKLAISHSSFLNNPQLQLNHMKRLNLLEETRYEKLPVTVYQNKEIASRQVAERIAAIIRNKAEKGEMAVLGLATGATPIGVYAELVKMHKEEGLSFQNVITFNLDEYYPMKPTSVQSYVYFMKEHLFDHVDIKPENINIPDGTLSKDEIHDYCLRYEQKITEAGGIDLQVLGIGRTGHIGFNEPGSAPNSGTRLVTLDDLTRRDASRDFGGKENVPTKAITMGIGTIFKAREIILMAWSGKKAPIIKKAVEGSMSSDVPATYLQNSENVEFILDQDAAGELTRFDTPWLVKDCVWDPPLIKKAVIWLSNTVKKPILKLTDEDYNNHGMAQLAVDKGPA